MACSKDFYSNHDENIVAGYDFKQVVEDKALECSICLLLLQQTMGTPCSHLYCLVCLQKLIGRRDIRGTTFRCPECNIIVNTNQVFPNAYIDRCVRGSNVYCQQHKQGCFWKGTLAEYFKKHGNECDFKVVTCKYEGCEVSAMRRRMMKDHELHCPFRIVQCNHCTTEVRENELELHYQFCEKFPTNCKENGCNATVPKNEVARKNVEKHLEVNTQQHMMFICEKYQNMENAFRTDIEILKSENTKQNVKIENQNTEIENLKTENKELEKRISKFDTKPKVSLATNQSEQNLKNPSCPVVDINELLLKGADRWIRKKNFDFDENSYDVWFKNIFDLRDENKLYQYNDMIYAKVKNERRNKVRWFSNSKKQQEKKNMDLSKEILHKGKDGLLLRGWDDWLYIHTETFDVFKISNSSCMIIHPQQQQKIHRMEKGIRRNELADWYVGGVPNDFSVNNFLIFCLMKD